MTDLIACVSSQQKSWSHVQRLIKEGNWNRVIIITNQFGKENFRAAKEIEFTVVDFEKPVFELIEDIKKGLKARIVELEVAVNIVSGSGKDHMAILSALLKIGVGIRFMAVTKEGVKEL